jgi:uncharacterized protein
MVVTIEPLSEQHLENARALLAQDAVHNMYLLGVLEEFGLAGPEASPFTFWGRFESGALTALVFVGGSGELVIPAANSVEHTTEIAKNLSGQIDLRACQGEAALVDCLVQHCGAKVEFSKEQVLYSVSADDLGPFTNPALRLAVQTDLDGLVPLATGAVHELFQVEVSDVDSDNFRERVRQRIVHQRTYLLEVDGSAVFKLDIGPKSRFGAELEGLYTTPSARGKGHATLSLGQISRYLMSSLPRLTVRVDKSSERFAKIARRVGYVPGRAQRWVSCSAG